MQKTGCPVNQKYNRITKKCEKVEYGYRAGYLTKSTPGFSSEGIGLYVAKKRDLADFFSPGGNVKKIYYKKPKKLLVVNEEILPLLQDDRADVVFESIKPSDTEWIKIHKKTIKKLKVDDLNWYKKQHAMEKEITQMMKSKGYDAVKVMSGGERWDVLLDEKLWRGLNE